MDLIEWMIVEVIEVLGSFYELLWGDKKVDFIFFFVRCIYDDLFVEHVGVVFDDSVVVVGLVGKMDFDMGGKYLDVVKNFVFEEMVEDCFEGLVFVVDYLVSICLLIKCK